MKTTIKIEDVDYTALSLAVDKYSKLITEKRSICNMLSPDAYKEINLSTSTISHIITSIKTHDGVIELEYEPLDTKQGKLMTHYIQTGLDPVLGICAIGMFDNGVKTFDLIIQFPWSSPT